MTDTVTSTNTDLNAQLSKYPPGREVHVTTYVRGLPAYRYGHAPAGLVTRRQLREAGLSTRGLSIVGYLYLPRHNVTPLYEPTGARPVRPITPRQRAALDHGRYLANTVPCAGCGTVRVWPDEDDPDPRCDPCAEVRRVEEQAAACARAEASAKRAAERLAADLARWTATDWAADIPAGEAPDRPTAWARRILADPTVVILDTETTGLDDAARIVEIAVVTTAGRILINETVDPGEPIPRRATRIHGITDHDVTGAATWADLYPRLRATLEGRRVVIYNSTFDLGMFTLEVRRAEADRPADDPAAYLAGLADLADGAGVRLDRPDPRAWVDDLRDRTSCAMDAYATWVGEVDDYYGGYRWWPLNGGHRAISDCFAVLERLRTMARRTTAEETP